jgi:broad specificity phosphatase PhoE
MQGKWQDQTKELQRWQQSMRDCLLELKEDTAIFTHFVAINAMVAAATNNNSVLVFKPDNGSITQFDTGAGELRLLNRGKDAVTHVN